MTDNKAEQFELNKSGIRISYLRFLSDSASGYIAILIFLFLYYYKICNIYVLDICSNMFQISVSHTDIILFSEEVEIFVLILLFLLATPLGLFINASGWVLLGKLQIESEKFWIEKDFFLIKSTKEKFLFNNSKKYFKINKNNFYYKSKFIEEKIRIYYPNLLRYLDHVEGVKNFIRTIILLLFFVFILHLIILCYYFIYLGLTLGIFLNIFSHLIIIIIFSILLIIILSIITFYYDSYIAFLGYLLYSDKKIQPSASDNIILF